VEIAQPAKQDKQELEAREDALFPEKLVELIRNRLEPRGKPPAPRSLTTWVQYRQGGQREGRKMCKPGQQLCNVLKGL
jgi:hypothetical protein